MDDEERTKNKGKVERRSEIERKTGRRGEEKRRRRGVSPRVLSRVQGVTSYFPRRYFCLRSVTRGSSEWCPGHLEMPARFSFISRCIRAFPDDRSPTAYSTRFRIVVCGRSTSPKKTFSSRGERLAPPYAPPVPLHALQVVPVWWIRVSPSSFFVLLYACRIHGRGKDTGVRGWVHTWVYVCQM